MKKAITSAVIGPDGKPVRGVQSVMLKAVSLQRPLVLAYLRRLRRKNEGATAAELAKLVERDFLLTVTGGGAAVGATAAVPGVGTATSLGLSAAATVGFLEASALYAQSLAELHGIATDDPDKARALVMAILMGDEGSSLIASLTNQAAGQGTGPVQGWASAFGGTQSKGLWTVISSSIQKRFMKKMLATQGASLVGRAIPFGIGAAVGGAANRFLGKKVVQAAGLAFGPMPTVIPGEVLARTGDPVPAGPADRPGKDADAARAAAEVEREIEAERRRRAGSAGS